MPSLPQDLIDRAASYRGDGRTLEAALGAYMFGQLYGWRVSYMMHAQSTLRRYEKILGAPLAELCPETTDLSRKSVGLAIADRVGAFWRVAKGSDYTTERKQLSDASGRQGSLL